jgi:predicted TIM-barrel fold metal-dependent hydrolase
MIDFHMHAFPDQLAERAIGILSKNSGGIEPVFDGTISGLKSMMKADGVDYGVVLMIATKPSQEASVNRFAIENNKDNLVFFGSIHPKSKHVRDHLKQLKEAGIHGIKLHPEYQGFSIDDPDLLPIYAMIAEMGLITVFHTGIDIGFDYPGHSRPHALARVLPAFQGAPVVAAHFGGYMLWDEVTRELIGQPIYLDTSYCHSRIPLPVAKRLIRDHGADRILFGSDAPWSRPSQEIIMIDHLDLTEQEKDAILDGNARRLLSLPARSSAPC